MTETVTIFSDIIHLPNVGEKRAAALNDLGIFTIYDLLQHYPFRYEDLSVDNIAEIEDKQSVVLQGEVISEPVVSYFAYRKSRLNFTILVNGIPVPVTFFNQPYYKKQIKRNDHIIIYGRFDGLKKSLVAQRLLSSGGDLHEDGLEPVYPANAGIKQGGLRKLIKAAYDKYHLEIPEHVPLELKKKYRLIDHQEAVKNIHFPQDERMSQEAVRAIKFEEFFTFQLRLQETKMKKDQIDEAYIINYDVTAIQRFTDSLSFEPTGAQKRVVNEVCVDFKSPFRMRRMLQGDVGSGKTMVAAAAVVAAHSAGKQTAFMVPTEILAEQHASSLEEMFAQFDLSLALMTGSTTDKRKKEILHELSVGTIDLVVGTHALIQETVNFNELGFVIIDEQHRFGVNQRETLEKKGNFTNILYMTATPIPRSMALTSYGDMSMSIIDELPKGRKAIDTRWIQSSDDQKIDVLVEKALSQGSQVYVINALIDESETVDLQTALETYEKYRSHYEPQFKVGLLHGKMTADEKEHIMRAFKSNEIQILISTTVIEVGVDVPNANLMVIYDAERFGLAQLHQLRGRVGRGDQEAVCLLVGQPKTEIGKKRLSLMTESQDGFYLSEKDLELRGPGDIFGQRQSGLPKFKMADIIADYPILEVARKEALIYIKNKMKNTKTKEISHENRN